LSCNTPRKDFEVEGYKPIYVSYEELNKPISTQNSTGLKNPGKIYYYNKYILVSDGGRGIHIIDNTNPANPILKTFIKVPANRDMAIKNNYLYADSYTDLVVIDISDMNNIREVDRIKNAFPNAASENLLPQKDFPDPQTGFTYFECPDKNKGVIVGWQRTKLKNPKCKI
ncbi:MAG: hypothetical protein RML38_01340, partial [Bacteroidia bacterium]|nr:hypothetical protein [Bacteroidia bacterium]